MKALQFALKMLLDKKFDVGNAYLALRTSRIALMLKCYKV